MDKDVPADDGRERGEPSSADSSNAPDASSDTKSSDTNNSGTNNSCTKNSDTNNSDTKNSDTKNSDTKQRSLWRELPVLVLVALLLAYLIKTFLVQAFYIPSESMENTLLVGDRVLVNKLSYRFGEIQRGDVVVFDGTDSFEPIRTRTTDERGPVTRFLSGVAASFGLGPGSESDYIKRVIGVGGDHVVCCDTDGNLTVNDVAIEPEDYLFPGDEPSATPFDITVPANRIWVMGDHRSRSEDSRAHIGRPGGGTVAADRVVGRAFVKVWPLGRLDTLSRPDAFAAVGASSSSN